MCHRFSHLALCAGFASLFAPAQEMRSMIFGRVLDPQGSAVAAASVQVRNADTGVALNYRSNATGYYEANLLLPGTLALHSNVGASDYSVGVNIGGNSWTLDRSPNQGPSRHAAYLPYTDAVAEFKVETNIFDASISQSSGASVTKISKSGTNEHHGTMTWQHGQQLCQGTRLFVKQTYYRRIAQAEAEGNSALASRLRAEDEQPTGRSNNSVTDRFSTNFGRITSRRQRPTLDSGPGKPDVPGLFQSYQR